MNITGIIAEYNPFHNGHAYQIQEARHLTNADYIVIVMSGDFVQRGEPAIIDKYARTQMALLNGADLVIELPVRHATGSAEFFARGGINILNGLKCITHLCFGSECGNIESIKDTANLLNAESDEYRCFLQDGLRKGLSFPQAREKALQLCGHLSSAVLLSSPNNILGVEYCRALSAVNSSIEPVTIVRKGASYHSTDHTQYFSSATAIRSTIMNNLLSSESSVPPAVERILHDSFGRTYPVTSNDFSSMLHYHLLSLHSWKDLTKYFDIPDTVAQRIFRMRYEFRNIDSFVNLIKTKNITELSVRRALIHILLQINTDKSIANYARVLGFQKNAAPLLKEIKTHSQIPFITKPSETKDLLAEDIFASQVYHSVITKKFDAAPYDELRQSMILI